MTTIGAIIDILSIVSNTTSQELLLISQLNSFFNFDHNVFLLDSSIDVNRFIRTSEAKEFTPQSLFIFQSADGADHFTGLESFEENTAKNTFLIIAPETASFQRNLNLFSEVKQIQKLQLEMKIAVFFSQNASKADIQELFKLSWKNRIINIFVATYGSTPEPLLNVFTFNPFGTFEILNVTSCTTFDKFFPSQQSNFQQYPLRIGKGPIEKRSVKLWEAVLRVMNASFIIVNDTDLILSIRLNSTIDYLPGLFVNNPLTAITRKYNLYPMTVNSMVLLVPEALPYSEFTSYLQTITSDPFFGYSLIAIAIVILILTTFRYIDHKKIVFFESAADVLNLLINDNGKITYRKLSRIEILLIVPLTLMGFVIVNDVFSTLQSYLTRPFLQPQIKTIEDIYQSQLLILTHMDKFKSTITSVLTDLSPHPDWNDRLLITTNRSIVDERRVAYDTSVIHMVQLDFANRLLRLQRRLNIKGYHLVNIKITSTIGSYIAHPEFPFAERFNEIIHWIKSAGLYDRWLLLDYADSETFIINGNLVRLENNNNDIERFSFPTFILYGWVAGIIVFFIEIIWNIFIDKFYKKHVGKIRKHRRIFGTQFESYT